MTAPAAKTPTPRRITPDEPPFTEAGYYLRKRGLYYRPKAAGYTQSQAEAGVFSYEYAFADQEATKYEKDPMDRVSMELARYSLQPTAPTVRPSSPAVSATPASRVAVLQAFADAGQPHHIAFHNMRDLARHLETELAASQRYAATLREALFVTRNGLYIECECNKDANRMHGFAIEMADAALAATARDHIVASDALVAAAREDSERLDWLEHNLRNMDSTKGGSWLRIGDNGRLQIHFHATPHHPTHLIWHDEFCSLDSIPDKPCGVRAAIDAARKEGGK